VHPPSGEIGIQRGRELQETDRLILFSHYWTGSRINLEVGRTRVKGKKLSLFGKQAQACPVNTYAG